jgi:hypothetical protein
LIVNCRCKQPLQCCFRLGKKFVAIHGGKSEIPQQGQGLIAIQPLNNAHQHLPQGVWVEEVKDAPQRIVAGRTSSPLGTAMFRAMPLRLDGVQAPPASG